MESYYDCPCGHRLSDHIKLAEYCRECDCAFYHGHRVGGPPHDAVDSGEVAPTAEMKAGADA